MYWCKIRVAAVFICMIFLLACEKKNEQRQLFAVNELLDQQINLLASAKATLQKTAIIGNDTNSVTFSPKDSSAWSRELDIFRELDVVNKPIHRSAYTIQEQRGDGGSQPYSKEFVSTKDVPVPLIRIYYHANKIKKLEAIYRQKTSLYKSSRYLSMTWDEGVQPVLTHYSIKGGQKMILGDTMVFELKGTIALP